MGKLLCRDGEGLVDLLLILPSSSDFDMLRLSMNPVFTRSLGEISEMDVSLAGGKGAALGGLMQAGFPVPPGFVVLADAFRQVLEAAELQEEIQLALRGLRPGDQEEIERASSYIRAQFAQLILPADLMEEVFVAYDALATPFVAVRSSATVEDGMEAAWAGQLESYLEVTRETLIDRIKDCWSSLFTPRAILYCLYQELAFSDVAVAVVVQQMIESEAAGVAFSVHPVTQEVNQVVIEAGYGLGEAVVSGQITPEMSIVQKEPFQLIEVTPHRQERALHRGSEGGVSWQVLTPEERHRPVLTKEERETLTQLVCRVEAHERKPVDIEWSKYQSAFFLLQSRPITTFVPSHPVSALFSQPWRLVARRRFNWFVESIQLEAMERSTQERFFGFTVPVSRYLILDGAEYASDETEEEFVEPFSDAFKKDPNFFQRFAQREEEILADAERYTTSLREEELASLPTADLIMHLRMFSERYLASFAPAWVRPDAYLEKQVRSLLESELQLSPEAAERVLEDIATPLHPNLLYTNEPLALLRVAKHIRDFHGSLHASLPIVDELLEHHREQYGWMKNPLGMDLVSFTIEDYRARVDHLLRQNVDELLAQAERVRFEREEHYRRFLERYQPSAMLRTLTQALRAFIWLRTRTTEISDALFFTARQRLFAVIAERAELSSSEVVSLSTDELIDLLRGNRVAFLREVIEERNAAYAIVRVEERNRMFRGPEAASLIQEAQKVSSFAEDEGEDALVGRCASPGSVQGIARVIQVYEDIFQIQVGDILLATMTLPEYAAGMEKAAAFVTDEGGVTCHAAIIAREMGKPCVIGTERATRFFRSGDVIVVEAGKGIVRRLKPEERVL